MRHTRAVLVAISLSLIFLIVYRRYFPKQNTFSSKPDSPYTLQVHAIPIAHNLSLGDFEIPGKSTHDVKIGLDEPKMRNARLSGYFSVESGPGVQVMLVDDVGYQKVHDNAPALQYLYLSKPAQKGNIEAEIPHPGTYYLIFDNSSSASSAKVKA
ncbi:MAG TPA: hypothetical protein VKY31_10215, partial [Terriglobia bacterium]|nr:hypothetical protein [Terriglobia bacterium]